MRILVHDYGGHAFAIQLSRELARRGHAVFHRYSGSVQTPQGPVERRKDDPANFDIKALSLKRRIEKRSLLRRWWLERAYGRLLAEEIARLSPSVVLCSGSPVVVQLRALDASRRAGARFVAWVQDLFGLAAYSILRRKLPVVGAVVGRYLMRLDDECFRRSDAVVSITEDFVPALKRAGADESRIHVIENWALMDEMPVRPKRNAWAERQGLSAQPCFLYSGTLSMKHNPALLLDLAEHFRRRPDWRVVVASEGVSPEWLKEQGRARTLGNLTVMGFQPFEQIPDAMGAADVLVAILEPDASAFSVPSKVLSYMCAGRALLLAVPSGNLAARIVARHEMGMIVPPGDTCGFLRAAEALACDAALRQRMGANARRYAEEHFDIRKIASRFEGVFDAALAQSGPGHRTSQPVTGGCG